MKKIVYVEDIDDLREIYCAVISSLCSNEIVEFANGQDALEYINKENDNIAVVITDINLPEVSGIEIFQNIKSNSWDLPVILVSGDDESVVSKDLGFYDHNPNNSFLQKPVESTGFKNALEFLTKESSGDIDYKNFPLPMVKRFESTPCDLYIRISESKVIKIFHQGTVLKDSDFLKFEKKGVKNFLIAQDDIEAFSNFLIDLSKSLLAKLDKSFDKDSMGDLNEVHRIVTKNLVNLGVNEKSLAMAKKSIDVIHSNMAESSDLKGMLGNILEGKDFISEHSMATTFLCFLVLEELKWSSPQSQMKFTLAGFLHNATLRDIDDETVKKLETDFNIDRKSVAADYPQFFLHPGQAVQLVNQFKQVPPDVDSIIAQHHELPNGKGFPSGLSSSATAPLSALFNTCHYFIGNMYGRSFTAESRDMILDEMDRHYDTGNYKKPYQALKSLFNS